ncbi:MAG: hypothetical protein QW175_07500 [Candidatus Bathyarchaeia archaeon]
MGSNDIVLIRTTFDDATRILNTQVTPQLVTYLKSRFYNVVDLYGDKAYKEQLLYACIQYLPAVVCGFSHGTDVSLISQDGTPALDIGTAVWMNNKIVYLFACRCGKELAQALIDNGAKAVLAFDDIVYLILDENGNVVDGYAETCLVVPELVAEGLSVRECYDKAVETYNKWIEHYENNGETLIADLFRWNRDHFVLKGSGESRIGLSMYLFVGLTDVLAMANVLIWGVGNIAIEAYRAYKLWKGVAE